MNWIEAMMASDDWKDEYLDWTVEYGSSSFGLHLNMVEAKEMALTTLGIVHRGSRDRRELRFSHSGSFPSMPFGASLLRLLDVIVKTRRAVFVWNHERVG
jgi:hypothetical protein